MSKPDKEHYEKLQREALAVLEVVKQDFAAISKRLDELEHHHVVQEYFETKERWRRASEDVQMYERGVGTWTYCLTQIKE